MWSPMWPTASSPMPSAANAAFTRSLSARLRNMSAMLAMPSPVASSCSCQGLAPPSGSMSSKLITSPTCTSAQRTLKKSAFFPCSSQWCMISRPSDWKTFHGLQPYASW